MRSPAMVIASVVFLWAVCWVSSTSCTSHDIDSELLESETGWQLDDEEIEVFDGPAPATAPAAAAPAPKASGNTVTLINGDFESTNLTGNASTTLADNTSTAIINWQPGGAGVQILNGNTYQMSSFKKGIYAIHLNNPASTANGTQGSLSTTLAINPPTGKSFTVQFDCARCPDAPINLFTAMKISSVSGVTVNSWEIRRAPYNSTDTQKQITYVRYSFGYTGTGATTQLKFESMSEKYGCIFDNVVILNGNHALAAAPGSAKVILWQKIFPVFSVLALLTVTSASPSSILSAL